jgi:hypothetical protein
MKLSTLLFAGAAPLLALCTAASAAPAIYRDNVMTIDAGALIQGNNRHYYGDIELQADASGKLMVKSATRLPLVYVDSVIADVVEADAERSVTLTIAGNKSVPCVALKDAAVSYKDKVFTVLLAETVMGPAESCIAVLDPFEVEVPLDIHALDSGTYTVEVNGDSSSFVLTTDANLAD